MSENISSSQSKFVLETLKNYFLKMDLFVVLKAKKSGCKF